MGNHWPVIVGINQYQSLQPLMFAQADAIELRDLLVNEAKIPAENCSLLTDISPMVYQSAASPTQEIMLQRLRHSCEKATPDDTVWFFFSGYGVTWEGQDYLLPIDADPDRVAETGIPAKAIFDTLQQSASQGLVILDMNRSQAALPNQRLGVQSMELAKRLAVPLILSCRPNQFSQETLAIRHGLFTAAILEGIRFHGCLTLSQLVAYVADRVPELCEHHWRPEQNPVVVLPAEYQFMLLVPPSAAGEWPIAEPPPPPGPEISPGDIPPDMVPNGDQPGSDHASVTDEEISDLPAPLPEPDPSMPPSEDSVSLPADPAGTATAGWQRWGILAAGLVLLALLLKSQTFFGRRAQPDPVAIDPIGQTLSADPASTDASPEAGNGSQPQPGEPLFPNQPGTSDAAAALERARAAINDKQFSEALSWLNQVPEDQRNEDYAALLEQAEDGYASVTRRTGEDVLNTARQQIRGLPASAFNDAIEQARQVPMGDPNYRQAQQDIQRWSQTILDMAEGRAALGNFDAAIAAAQLVPDDQQQIYEQAQAEIQRWQQRKTNRQILQQAQGLLQPDQATTFKEAIELVQQIPQDYPEYAVAQQRTDQWSQDILVIARARAAAGNIPAAIAAAERVPPDTSAYQQAIQEIQQWQTQE
jgi:tetratricopeptide (TPR) repeat protein